MSRVLTFLNDETRDGGHAGSGRTGKGNSEMTRRLIPLAGMVLACGVWIIGVQTSPAGASSWTTYAAQCSKWISDIPKLDSYIIEDNRDGNRTALTASIIALYADGKHIAVCDGSPDTQLNSIARRWGAAIENAGAYGYRWVTHETSANLLAFVSAVSTAKKYENQFSNRLTVLGR
jgi:hypothetical protein